VILTRLYDARVRDAGSRVIDTQYEDLLRHVLSTGIDRPDRTGTGSRGIFGHQLRYDLAEGFPLITPNRVPFRTIAYALLTHLVAAQVGLEVGDFVWTGGDCHIYDNHLVQVREQLDRPAYVFPSLRVAPAASLFDYSFDDFEVLDYRHHPALRAPVAV